MERSLRENYLREPPVVRPLLVLVASGPKRAAKQASIAAAPTAADNMLAVALQKAPAKWRDGETGSMDQGPTVFVAISHRIMHLAVATGQSVDITDTTVGLVSTVTPVIAVRIVDTQLAMVTVAETGTLPTHAVRIARTDTAART